MGGSAVCNRNVVENIGTTKIKDLHKKLQQFLSVLESPLLAHHFWAKINDDDYRWVWYLGPGHSILDRLIWLKTARIVSSSP